jgi:hypothetical protein
MSVSARSWRHSIVAAVVLSAVLVGAGWAVGQANSQYLHFPGPTASYVEVPHNAALVPASAITIELWVRLASRNSANVPAESCISLLGKNWNTGYWFGVCSGFPRFYHGGSTNYDATAAIDVNQWKHLAVTYDGVAVKFYIDGTEVTSTPSTGGFGSNTSALRIGSDVAWNYTPLGDIDEVRIWNLARTASQIHDAMGAPISSAQPGLVALWHMDGNATDSVGGFNGSVVGNATFAGGSAPACTYSYFVATTGHIPGSGGVLWASDLIILNKAIDQAAVYVYELKRDGVNTNQEFFTESIAGGENRFFADVILNRFSGSNQAAALRVCSDKELVVASKTYATSATGTYGYGAPGPSVAQAIAPGQAKWLVGLTENAAFRTNVGFVNTTATPAVITVSVYDQTGHLLRSPFTYDLDGFGHIQRSRFLREAYGDGMANCSVKIQVTGSAVFAYSTVTDNGNGDGTFYLAE